MSKVAAFWDSSALVPLCVHEVTSRQAQSRLRKLSRFAGVTEAQPNGSLQAKS